MKYYWKCYIYDKDMQRIDYTSNLTMPIFYEDRLDETLDTAEIVLKRVYKNPVPFSPKTWVKLERYITADFSDIPEYFDMVVEHDDVQIHVGMPDYTTHRVHLIEAAVVAQGMSVDNFALSYELNDVSFDYNYESFDGNKQIGNNLIAINQGNDRGAHTWDALYANGNNTKTFSYELSLFYRWSGNGLNDIRSLFLNVDGTQAKTISFQIPQLYAAGDKTAGNLVNLFEVETVTNVIARKFDNSGNQISATNVVLNRYCGAVSYTPNSNISERMYYRTSNEVYARRLNNIVYDGGEIGFALNDSIYFFNASVFDYTSDVRIAVAKPEYADKTIAFTTFVLTPEEISAGVRYRYDITCGPANTTTLYQTIGREVICRVYQAPFPQVWIVFEARTGTIFDSLVETSQLRVSASFHVLDLSAANPPLFLSRGESYNALQLLRKAMLTIDTKYINTDASGFGLDTEGGITYPIIISSTLSQEMLATEVYETVFNQKNLWEIMLQIGYYLHAIPYLEFAKDGTKRYELQFLRLGNNIIVERDNRTITQYNTHLLSDFFSSFDCYVKNFYSPQLIVDEWIVPKTDDNSFLVSNNTAVLHAAYGIFGFELFDIKYNGASGGTAGTKSALNRIFYKEIYDILSNANPRYITPAKGNSLFFVKGDKKIQGLNLVGAEQSTGDTPMSLKLICNILFGADISRLKFNDLMFHIRYRTYDALRLEMVKPTLEDYVKNSYIEQFPHNSQFFGQQDEILDSIRYSNNVYGKLNMLGNAISERQEKVNWGSERKSGELVHFGDAGLHYVSTCSNEYYSDTIKQKVSYSKNFNRLSQIVTIPSEPRVYEVPDKNLVDREILLRDFICISSVPPELNTTKFMFFENGTWKNFIKALIFGDGQLTYPNYAYTKFQIDPHRVHKTYAGIGDSNNIFPSSEVIRTGGNSLIPKASNTYSECVVPLLTFPLKDGIIFEWGMADNFKAGDFIDTALNNTNSAPTNDGAYYSMQPYRYVDLWGRADAYNFKLINLNSSIANDINTIRAMPKAIPEALAAAPIAQSPDVFKNGKTAIALDKDAREVLAFNYKLSSLYKTEFVTFQNLFARKNNRVKMQLMNRTVGAFEQHVDPFNNVLAEDVQYDLISNDTLNAIQVSITLPAGVNVEDIQSIMLYESEIYSKKVVFVKNVDMIPNADKLKSWWIYPVYND